MQALRHGTVQQGLRAPRLEVLGEVQRDAARGAPELRRVDLVAAGGCDQTRRVVFGECVDLDDRCSLPQVAREQHHRLGSVPFVWMDRRDDRDGDRVEPVGQEPEVRPTGRVDAVEVVEDENRRARASGEAKDHVGEGFEEPQLAGRRSRRRRQLRHETGHLCRACVREVEIGGTSPTEQGTHQ